jgi:hypothetical protein
MEGCAAEFAVRSNEDSECFGDSGSLGTVRHSEGTMKEIDFLLSQPECETFELQAMENCRFRRF